MAWKIEFRPEAEKELAKLDGATIRRILTFLDKRLKPMENPRAIGEALRGQELGKYWKYRVGDYRLICSIQDKNVCILVIRIGHRREVYR
jgi:mRNA interferase RelE/StbE